MDNLKPQTPIDETAHSSQEEIKNHQTIKKDKKDKSLLKVCCIFLVGLLIGAGLMTAYNHFTIKDAVADYMQSNGSSTVVKLANAEDGVTAAEYVAEAVTPAVVGIETVEITQDMFNRSYENSGVGTGFIVSKDGYIVTNFHVVTANPKTINVTLKSGDSYEAKKVWGNEDLDIAIIKINAKNLPTVELGDSEKINVGQTAIAIGNPLGLTFERTVTSGIVSALNRSIVVDDNQISEDLIQTDASINSGNSGGPLLNKKGQVVGINTYKVSQGEGMGFAIPINVVKPILEQIFETGTFEPVSLGISGVDKEIARYMTDNTEKITYGIYLVAIQSNSPADAAGLRKGDLITKIDGTEVNTMLKLRELLYYHQSGDKVKITFERNGHEKTVTTALK